MPWRQERGQTRKGERYGLDHQRQRRAAARRHRPEDPCARCGHPLGPMGAHLHYDHDENGGYLGFSHGSRRCPYCGRKCNISAGAVKGNRISSPPRSERAKLSERTCSICKDTFQPRRNGDRTCSTVCRDVLRAKYQDAAPREPLKPRQCSVCGSTFQPIRAASVACSPECRTIRAREQTRRWKEAHPGSHAVYQREWKKRRANLDL